MLFICLCFEFEELYWVYDIGQNSREYLVRFGDTSDTNSFVSRISYRHLSNWVL